MGQIVAQLDVAMIDRLAEELVHVRERGGRLFLIGVGGSAATCSHAVNDFRKLCGIEAYSPVDNVAELTARTNDEGWETVFQAWIAGSQASERDALFVLSVGGGDAERNISVNLIRAIDEAKNRRMKILGIVGRQGGYTRRCGDTVVLVPTVNEKHVTPHTETLHSAILHCLASHPRLQTAKTKWESAVASVQK